MGTTGRHGLSLDEVQMTFCFSKRSLGNLEDVHPDLVEVVKIAGELCDEQGLDFIITDGSRTIEEQREFVAQGKSKTMHSRHLGGFAIDFVARCDRRASYDGGAMKAIADCFKEAGRKYFGEDGLVEWGGDWETFKDTPHIQLSKKRYPDVVA